MAGIFDFCSYLCRPKGAVMPEALPTDTSTIRYVESDLSVLVGNPCHFKCGVYLVCTAGEGVMSTGVQQFFVDEQTELIFLTGGLLEALRVSEGFCARVLLFPSEVFLKAVLPIDTPYFNYTHEHPYYRHTPDARSQKTWREILLWMDMARMLFVDGMPQFRRQQEHNFLQSLLMWLFNTIPDKLAVGGVYSRKQIICHQFLQLIREHSTVEHQVAYYAEQLCISPRYLYEVTMQCMEGKSPKQLIDEQLLAEVKVLLNEPRLSVTEIAVQLNFSDQSYLTRFFKKSTGISPKEYRSRFCATFAPA